MARGKRWLIAGAVGLAVAGLGTYAVGRAIAGGGPQAVLDLNGLSDRTTTYRTDCRASPRPLQAKLHAIAQGFDGIAGIAVSKVGCDWIAGERLGQYFPQQSVSKLWVSVAALDAVDRGKLRLDQQLTIGAQDLTLFNQPLRAEVLEQGAVQRPVLMLMQNALSLSDNTANDKLLWTLGGPDKIRGVLRRNAIRGVRFGPGERLLQSEAAGLAWQPEYSLGRNFEQARVRLPREAREAALARYLADPADGATPAGMVEALGKLAKGELLSPEATRLLLDIMGRSRSGPRRLKGGLPPGWHAYHKTGTGQELFGLVTGYNDVAVIEAPDGTLYTAAVLIGQTRLPIQERMAMMQAVSAALAKFHDPAAAVPGLATGSATAPD
jgi:beta-lactamase class A